VVTLRAVRPADVAALRAFVQRLSPESRYLRFHASVSDFSQAQWEYLASVDGWNHVAVVAWIGPAVVGVGRFIRLEGAAEKAEVAFAVADALQRRGLGSLLLEELVAAAVRSGILSFRAEVLAENRGIRRLLLRSSLRVVADGENAIEVALD
jgi:GNAT superfamily N-acetyltransferase